MLQRCVRQGNQALVQAHFSAAWVKVTRQTCSVDEEDLNGQHGAAGENSPAGGSSSALSDGTPTFLRTCFTFEIFWFLF